MKFLSAQIAYFLQNRSARRNVVALGRLVVIFVLLVATYSILFHFLMAAEGQDHSWLTGVYWTLTVMSTLGFGDITFQTDAGRAFSMVVLLSGIMFLLVLLPFTFIQFFYAPWIEAQTQARTPRELPPETTGHVIITQYDPVTMSLIDRLAKYGREYVVLEPDPRRARDLYEQGVRVMLGDRDNRDTFRCARVDQAAMVVATGDDFVNTATAFTVREVSSRVPLVALARAQESIDIMELAGSSHVLHLSDMLGRSLARRTLGGETRANVIGRFDSLLIAEAPVTGTPLVGRTLQQSRLRETTGVTVVGMWERGAFDLAGPDRSITPSTVLVLAGSEQQLERFDELVAIYNAPDAPALILGAGRVGRAAARYLQERGIPCRLVDRNPDRVKGYDDAIVGSAADLAVLERAGIREAPASLVTTNHDETNIYLTIYCRRLRSNIQIISRATLERNVSTLHRAGADIVMSYSSMGANAIFNVLEQNDLVMLAEGLNVFRYPAPPALVGRTLAQSRIREESGCSVIAMEHDGTMAANPEPHVPIPADAELILIGTTEAEHRFFKRFRNAAR